MAPPLVARLDAPELAAATATSGGALADAKTNFLLADPQRRPIDYLRVSVTDRCNYRCTYCMPDDGVDHLADEDRLSFDEIVALVRVFARLGVTRVRLTGGEPTVRRNLVQLVRMLKAVPGIWEVALSTNGHLLSMLAAPLREAGLDRLNISIDSLDPEKFARITRRGDLARVLEGVEAARAAKFTSIKINTVAVKGFNDDEIPALCDYAWTRGLVPRFIEQMPMAEGRLFVPGELLPAAAIRAAIEAAYPGTRLTSDEGGGARGAGPARYWRLERANAGVVNGSDAGSTSIRRVGVISAMTEHFCDACNRLRLSSAGKLHACLAYDDATDLRAALHAGGDDAVAARIRAAVADKRDGHAFQLVGIGGPRKTMIEIGG